MEDLDFLTPELRARYTDLEEIGRGGMGQVFRAQDSELQRPVAIKILQAADFGGGKARLRFLEEGRICSQLTHPNVVRLYDFGAPEIEYPPFMIFEFIEGSSLDDWIAAEEYSADEALDVLDGIARGLGCAHDAGITHRDLKPENVLLHEGKIAKVADFGLAKDPQSSSGVRTRRGILLGTPPYMAPEYIRGEKVGPPADMYALGVMAYRILVGKLPFDHEETVDLLRAHVKEPVPDPRRDNPRLCDPLADLLMRCLAKKPADRTPDMGTFVKELARARKAQEKYGDPSLAALKSGAHQGITQATGFRVPAPGVDSTMLFRRRRLVAGAVACGIVLLGVGGQALSTRYGATARELEIHTSPSGIEATWLGKGSSDLVVRPYPEGDPVSGARVTAEGARHQGRVDGLRPGQEYMVEVRSGWTGSPLQSGTVTLPEEVAPPRIGVTLEGATGKPVLEVEGAHAFALRWRIEGLRGAEYKPLANGGGDDTLATRFRVPLEGVLPTQRVRLWTAVRPAGISGFHPEELVVNGTTLMLRSIEETFAGLDQESLGEALGAINDAATDHYRRGLEFPPEPVEHLRNHGVGPGISALLPLLGRYFESDVPTFEKARAEATLIPLAFCDAILRGSGYPPAFGLAGLRQRWLPDGTRTTLRPGRDLGTGWTAEKPHRPSLQIYPSEFERQVAARSTKLERSGLEYALGGELGGIDIQAWTEFKNNGFKVRATLEVPVPPSPGEDLELALETLGFSRRYFLLAWVNGKGPIPLWSQEADEASWTQAPTPSFFRLPPGLLERGPNTLEFGIHDWPGREGFMNAVKIYSIRLRAGRGS